MKYPITPCPKPKAKRDISAESRTRMGGHTRFQPKHGMKDTPEYRAWFDMRQRCSNPSRKAYKTHGARGIRVCPEWQESFEAFFADMGPRPDGFSLDRIDNDGNYEPQNCRWADTKTQQRNKRTNVVVEYRGQTYTLAELAESVGMLRDTLSKRLMRGMTVEEAIESEIRHRTRKQA